MTDKKKIILIGGGGHCLSVLDSLLSSMDYEDVGIIDKSEEKPSDENSKDKQSPENTILGVKIIGNDGDLQRLYVEGYTEAFITVGSVGDVSVRRKIYRQLKQIGFQMPNIIDKSSVVSKSASLGEGIYIGKNTVINAGTVIGNCAIINTAVVVEHECRVDEFAHIAPGTILCGNVYIGGETHIGAGSVVKQGICVGKHTIIGMGSVVLNDIQDDTVAYGNPCKEVEHE